MGLSLIKGNSGYIGIDKRGEVASTGTTGSVSVRKHYLERKRGNLEPITPDTGNVLFEDDFSTGDLSKWTLYNGSEPSQWEVNTSSGCLNSAGTPQTIPSGSTYAAFISDNGGVNNNYSNNSDAHMLFTFTVPPGTTSLILEFDWMCFGERASGLANYDYGYVNYINPTTFTPAAGTEYTTAIATGRERIIGSDTSPNTDDGKFTGDGTSSRNNSASSGWVYEKITIDNSEVTSGVWCDGITCTNGTTRGIMFSWASDSSVIDTPAFTIANVKLTYNI